MKNITNHSKSLRKNRNYSCNKKFLNTNYDYTFTIKKKTYKLTLASVLTSSNLLSLMFKLLLLV